MKRKILFLDDKVFISEIIFFYFSKEYDVYYFKNPLEAIEWMKKKNIPDLIISDIQMPEMDGEEFLHYIKTTDLYKCIPFIILSEESDSTDRINLLKKGAVDFISKPFNPVELKIKVDNLMKLYQPYYHD